MEVDISCHFHVSNFQPTARDQKAGFVTFMTVVRSSRPSKVFSKRKHNQSGMDFDSRAVEQTWCIKFAVKVPRKFFSRNCAPTICVLLCMTDVFIMDVPLVVCLCVCKSARIRVHIYRMSHLRDRVGKSTSEANVQIGVLPVAFTG